MTQALQENGVGQQASAISIWRIMSVGPIVFFLSALAVAVALYGEGKGWWRGIESEEDFLLLDNVIFGVPLLILVAETIATAVAYRRRPQLAGTPFESHATSAIRTFSFATFGFIASFCLTLPLLAIPNMNAIGFGVSTIFILAFAVPMLFIWQSVRIFRGVRRARQGEPIVDRLTRWS